MFERIAPRYDLANTVLSLGLHRRWKRAVVDAVLPRRTEPVRASEGGVGDGIILDAGAGTGDLACLAASRGAAVVAVDLSPAMLRIAAERTAPARRVSGEAGHVALLRADLSHLPLANGTVRAVMSAFALRHLPDLDQAFRELRRVLAPGGRVAILEFGRPRGWIRPFYATYSSSVIPTLGGWLTGDRRAYEFLVRSVRGFPEPPRIVAIIRASGFREVHRCLLSGGIAVLYTATASR